MNVVKEPWNRRPGALAHGDQLARTVDLDMATAGWRPTVDNYLGRVPKVRILEAVREAKGEQSAQLIDHLKKADMAKEAERLLEGTGWLPEPLRTNQAGAATGVRSIETKALPQLTGMACSKWRRKPVSKQLRRRDILQRGGRAVPPFFRSIQSHHDIVDARPRFRQGFETARTEASLNCPPNERQER